MRIMRARPVELGWNHEPNALVPSGAGCVFLRSRAEG